MPHIRQLCWVGLLCLSGSAAAANVRLQVEGLSGPLEKTSVRSCPRFKVMKSLQTDAFVRALMMPSAKG